MPDFSIKKQPIIGLHIIYTENIHEGKHLVQSIAIEFWEIYVHFDLFFTDENIKFDFIDGGITFETGEKAQIETMSDIWAFAKMGIVDFISMLDKKRIGMDKIDEYTIDENGHLPFSLEYYGFSGEDIKYLVPNQISLFA